MCIDSSSIDKKVSIIVPCYNVEDYIDECVESLVSQTIGVDNIEIILVDDASSDGTLDKLYSWEKKYSDSMIVVVCTKNGRQGCARNIGIEYASGKYISFVDSDDWISKYAYEALVGIAEKEDADIVQFRYSGDKDKIANTSSMDGKYRVFEAENQRKRLLLSDDVLNESCTTKLYKRDLILNSGVGFPEGVCYEEPLFTYPLKLYVNKVATTEEAFYYYRYNKNGTTAKDMSDLSTILDHVKVQMQLNDDLNRLENASIFQEEIDFHFIHSFYVSVFYFFAYRGVALTVGLFRYLAEKVKTLVPNYESIMYWNDKNIRDEYEIVLLIKELEDKDDSYIRKALLKVYKKIAEKNKIIDILIGIAHSGGVENIVNCYADYFVKKGNIVRIIQCIDAGKNWVTASGVSLHILSNSNVVDMALAEKYMEYLEIHGLPDVIIPTGWPLLCKIAKKAIDKEKIPIVYWPHMPIDQYNKFGNIADLADADEFVAINNQICNELSEAYTDKRVNLIYNCIDDKKIRFNDNRDIHHLAFVGRFDEVKNVDYIIKSMSFLDKKWKLTLVGAGPETEKLSEIVKLNHLEDKVRFLGWKENPWDELTECGFLVMASDSEGFSLVVLEALNCGMGVISTPVGMASEIIEHGKNGFIYEMGDEHALSKLLLSDQLVLCNAEYCRSSVGKYSIDITGNQFLKVIEEIEI